MCGPVMLQVERIGADEIPRAVQHGFMWSAADEIIRISTIIKRQGKQGGAIIEDNKYPWRSALG